MRKKIACLGHIIGSDGVKLDPNLMPFLNF